ncbi:MAG: hypothetical protein ACXADY_07925 [Candidatus Hodarchaeales archaeon]
MTISRFKRLLYKRWCKKVGLINKNIRYSFAHWFYETSVHDIKLTSDMLGHSSVAITTKYLEVSRDDMMSRARDVFEQ